MRRETIGLGEAMWSRNAGNTFEAGAVRLRPYESFFLSFFFCPCMDVKLVFFAKYNYNIKVKEDETDKTCNTHGGEEECI
jgi:hypothetical protein